MQNRRILVVEDEGITALDIKARLIRLGYSVPAVACSGDEAVRKAAELRPDLVLMDIRLRNGMDGIEAAHRIRTELDIPVVYLTAYTDDDTLQRAQQTEPFGYLVKPFEERELHGTIAMALHKHQSDRAVRESERRLRRYSERLHILHEIDLAILAASSPADIAGAALHHIQELVPCHCASVCVFDAQAGDVTVLATYSDVAIAADPDGPRVLEQIARQNRSEGGRSQRVEDLAELPEPSPLDQALLTHGKRSYVLAPLLVQGEQIGTLFLCSQAPGAFGGESLEIIHQVANSLALAIHHARVHEQLECHAALLEERNKELNAFAHTVVHDIKDPLSLIIGFAGVMEEDLAQFSDEELRHYLRHIARTASKMTNIVDELLLLSEVRTQEVGRQPLDMAQLVEGARQRLRHLFDERQAELTLPESWPVALGYGPWVEEVWVNYLSNGLKYGGQPPRMELGAAVQPDGSVRYWVRDNGPGIPPEAQARLFAPFTRLNQIRVRGQGLGLSIVRRIMEKLGGQAEVESRGVAGEGSVFSFTLPGVPD